MFFKDGEEFKLPEIEEKVLQFWAEHDVFRRSVALRQAQGIKSKIFRFFEGPPTANGRPGIHHVLARSFKDIVLRYKTMRGYYVPRRAGWDTHGLPVELEIEKELGIKSKSEIEQFGIAPFNDRAKASVWKYKDEWEKLTARVGFWLDFANPYVTYANEYVESLWWVFSQIAKKKLLKKSHKVVPWCPRCQTTLSSHELAQPGAYRLTKDPSAFVKFKIQKSKFKKNGSPSTGSGQIASEYLLVWTTTPWTLSANVAVAVNPKLTYTQYKVGDELLWSYTAPPVVNGITPEVVGKISGKKMIGWKYEPLYPTKNEERRMKNVYTVVAATFVETEQGTGLVHIAPAFGEDDFVVGTKTLKMRIDDIPMTVNEAGMITADVPGKGKFIKSADKEIIADLESRGLMYQSGVIEHDYPFCWRCSTPLIYVARSSWFIEMSRLRKKLLAENQKINWIPSHIKEGRFGEWLREVKDWAISRERYWGTPLPIWECEQCAAVRVIGGFADLDAFAYNPNQFWIMRHGEAMNNITDTLASGPDRDRPTLTVEGIRQVEAAAARFQKKKQQFDLIISSPIRRTKETAALIAKKLGVDEVVYDERLSETNFGIFNGRKISEYLDFFGGNELRRFTEAPPGAETLRDVRLRVVAALLDINKRYVGKRILIVSHGDQSWILENFVRGAAEADSLALNDFACAEVRPLPFRNLPRNDRGELDVHRPYIDQVYLTCAKCQGRMTRVKEVADVWFDSGAMPYAQWHYPFENKEKLDGAQRPRSGKTVPEAYPADYISEGMDQTRGWFYTLLAVATALGRKTPYLNVVSFGLLLDKNGQKMSKSKGNVIDPWACFAKYGADVVRWHFYTMNPPGEPKRLDENDLLKVSRRFFAIIYNSFVFLKTYGQKMNNEERRVKNVSSKNILDRWILARLARLVGAVTERLDRFEIGEAGRMIEGFVDDLSRWYIRRSRGRFRRQVESGKLKVESDEEQGTDHGQASQVLRHVLLRLSKLLAPFTPFFAEAIYQEIIKSKNQENKNMQDSVHLEDFPVVDASLIDESLIAQMEEVRRFAALGLAARASAKIKVRQPLGKLKVKSLKFKAAEELLDILKDEVNVKEIIVDPSIQNELELDTVITPELREEGTLREFVRMVQELRQTANYKPGEPATLFAVAPIVLQTVIEKNIAQFKSQTSMSCVEFKRVEKFDAESVTEFDGAAAWLAVRR